ncbi:GAF and ANTAR domain-containing protein [Saccharomonospora sp. NPDC046836]|uniref:GAF and ANTAR domain-containing protein n=1 Tax=Saccharomonospora sp. NPDC046836 TaxID=3156921 RepID=UPI00340673C5
MNDSSPTAAVSDEELIGAFVDMADTLVDDYDVVDLLQRLCTYCVTLLGATAAGILLADQRGGLQVVATSDERTRLLELLQLQNNSGPCLEAYRSGTTVEVENLNADQARWPAFAAEAMREGYRSVQAVPLRLREDVIGALDLFGQHRAPLTPQNLLIARALADTATIGILQERAIRRGEVLTEQLQYALHSRISIEQAKGVLAHAGRLPMDEAFNRLRRYSRNHGQRLSVVAERLARGALRPEELLR